ICMEAEWPAMRRYKFDRFNELALRDGLGRYNILAEISRIVHRPNHIFPGSHHAEMIVALAGLHLRHPSLIILKLVAGPLREERVADAHRKLLVCGELGDGLVIARIILPAAARVDHACYAEPVQLAHEMARRDDLLGRIELRYPREDTKQAPDAGHID